jgi:putative transposase
MTRWSVEIVVETKRTVADEKIKRGPRGKPYTEDEILKVPRKIDGGAAIAALASAHEITDRTLSWWREKYGGIEISELKELRSLQAENQRVKWIVARQAPEIDTYKIVTEEKW